MGYKNILFGVISSSLIALASHELTKRYEKNKACELFDEQDDRFLTLKENLDNEIRLKTDENKELRRRTTFLSKKLYHINQIDIVDEIDYITRSNLNKEKKYEAINISGQLNLPDEYKNNIFQIIETKIRLLETISEIKEFSYLKPDIKEINEMRKEPPYLVLSNDLTIRRQIQIDRMLNKLLNPVFYKMKDIIFEYEFNLSNKSKKEFDSLIYKTYEILDTDRYLDGEKCFRFFIATYKTICEIIVYNVYASENMDVHKEICSLFNHCNHMMFYLLQDGIISLENYLNNHSEEKDIINKLYKNIK